jgi:hypothetical protein
MTFRPVFSLAPFIATTRHFPVEDEEELERVITQTYTEVANAVNVREVGTYETVETITGQQFYSVANNQKKRYVYRKVFAIGAIAAGATATIAHNITSLVFPVNIYGVIQTDVPDWRPLVYATTVAGDWAVVRVDAVNVYVQLGAAHPPVTSGYVIMEYLKN